MNDSRFVMPPDEPAGPDLHTVREHFPPGAQQADKDYWFITYVDLLTVLLTFFVVLIAAAPDYRPPGNAETAVVAHGVVPEPVSVDRSPVGVRRGPARTGDESPTGDTRAAVVAGAREAFSGARPAAGVSDIAAVFKGQVVLRRDGDRVLIDIPAEVLFASGQATLTEGGKGVLASAVSILQRLSDPISVEGHTDNTPVYGGRYHSNWELSAHRAVAVTRFLIGEGIDGRRLRAVAFGDTRPVADNHTAAGRQRNRRVTLVVIPGGVGDPDTTR